MLKIGVLCLVVAVLLTVQSTAAPALAASERLPNLQALKAEDIRVEVVGNRKRLRFSTISQNAGVGPLELQGGEVVNGRSKQRVYQHVYLEGGEVNTYLVGEFVYHPGHRHFHLGDYARYTLTPVSSSTNVSPRTSIKTSFCIMDTTKLLDLPGTPTSAVYDQCGGTLQGMSVGWGDRYGYSLAGQEIDITTLPDGDYVLTITIDPLGKLRESTPSDNKSAVTIRIAGRTVEVLTP